MLVLSVCGVAGKLCNAFSVIQTLAHVCEVTNSSVNFLIYFSMGSRFRATVRELCGTRAPRPAPQRLTQSSLPTVSQEL